MKKQLLSERLKTIAQYVRKGDTVADIGSDHAYLPVYLIQEQIASKVIAGEVNKGPFEACLRNIRKHGLQHKIKAKLGDGLEVIEGEKIDTVIIAGMGGSLIRQILDGGKEKLEQVSRLILQPNIAAEHIRRWFIQENWELKSETILEEGRHIYEILIAEKGDPLAPYSKHLHKEIWLGPYLLREKNAIFKQKWEIELKQLKKVHESLVKVQSPSRELVEKKQEIEKKIQWLREELR